MRALYLAAGVTDLYAETGDESLLRVMQDQWDDLTASKLYLTGGIGSRHSGEAIGDPYELPPDRAYCETCAAIASIMWNWRMLLVTGESRYADLIERTFYNGFLSGISLDGETFFYMNPCNRGPATSGTSGILSPAARRTSCDCSRRSSSTSRRSPTRGVQIHQYAPATIDAHAVPTGRRSRCASRRVPVDGPDRGRDRRARRDRVDALAAGPGLGAQRLAGRRRRRPRGETRS